MKKLNSIFKFRANYFLAAMFLFLIEVAIAQYVHDGFIRPYIGDVLVVILLYYFIKSLINMPVLDTAFTVLMFSYLVELLQYFNFVEKIGLSHYRLANIVIGNYFSWADLLCYTIGITIVLIIETYITKPTN